MTNCHVAETMAKVLEKAEQMFAVSVVPKNAEPKRSIMEKIPAEGHQQCRAVVDFAAPEFRPRSMNIFFDELLHT